ncbi:MAG: ABC transporter substrate-binding protein [Oscillospiraceae bacterium]|jgi:putative aldouronate transport system substrate-binding protein|nr:ABC transporter substrate-binding protein [Oscillospiraceae bacterium]
MKLCKRFTCVALAVLIVIGAAACGNGTAEQSADQPSASTSASAAVSDGGSSEAAAPVADGEWQPTHDYSERLKITTSNVGVVEGHDFTSGDGLAQFYSDKFNIDLEVAATTYDNWDERMRVWINSGDMPDTAVINYKHVDFSSYVEQGLVKRFPDDWKERWPNLAKAFSVSTLGPKMEEVFDGTYFHARPRFSENLPGDPLPNHQSIFLRKDWAEAVGFPVKTAYTIPEIMEYLQLIQDQDPGKLGEKLIPLAGNPAYSARMFVYSNSAHYDNFYKDTDGVYKWGPASDDTLEGLKIFKEAYDKKLLNPEFYTYKIDQDIEQVTIQAVAGACYTSATTGGIRSYFIRDFEGNNEGLKADDCMHVATLLGVDGNYHQEDLINFWGVVAFNPDIDDAKFERYMDILDFNATPKGLAILNLGLEGEDWVLENGEYKSMLPEGTTIGGKTGKYPSQGYTLGASILFDDFAFSNPNIPKHIREMSRQLYAERCEIATPETFTKVDWDLYCYDSPSKRKVAFDYGTEYSSLVTMDGDIEANWRAWVDAKMAMVQPVLDELNALGQ